MTSRKPVRVAQTRTRKEPQPSRIGVIEFYRILDMLPERWRSYFVVLALTGLRIGDLYALRAEDLDHEVRAIRAKNAKTPSGVQKVYVAEECWPWVMAAVPVPVSYRHLRDNWNAAVDRAGLKTVTVTALRQLRNSLLAEAAAVRCELALAGSDKAVGSENLRDRRSREEASMLSQLLPVLTVSGDAGRRLLLRKVRT